MYSITEILFFAKKEFEQFGLILMDADGKQGLN